jgi:putative Holliday junction resolvase
MGIDYGTKRIGVALSDPLRILAQGVDTLGNSERVIVTIAEMVRRQDVSLIVVGMPYGADGGKSRKGLEVDEFIQKLAAVTEVPITTWDESYSSVNAKQTFIDSGMKKKKRQQKFRVDVMAARLMLQEYLDNFPSRQNMGNY